MINGAVAQLGERCVRNAEVEGSIPFRSTIFHRRRECAARFLADSGLPIGIASGMYREWNSMPTPL